MRRLGVIRIILIGNIEAALIRLPAWNFIGRDLLSAFFADRLKVALKEKGIRHDLIDAVFALGHEDDLVRLVARVEALQAFLKTDDGANLLAGYKRAANILKAEEKKDGKTFIGEVDEKLLSEPAEKSSVRRSDQGAKPPSRRRWRRKISPPPCSRWRPCAFRWMRSSKA